MVAGTSEALIDLMEIAILFALILLNGLFAMSEIALVTARKVRLLFLIRLQRNSQTLAAEPLNLIQPELFAAMSKALSIKSQSRPAMNSCKPYFVKIPAQLSPLPNRPFTA